MGIRRVFYKSVRSRKKSPRPQEEEGKLKMKPEAGLVPGGEEERLNMFLCSHEEAARLRCLLPGWALGRLSRKLEVRRDQQVLHATGAAGAAWMTATYLTWDTPSAEEQGAELS